MTEEDWLTGTDPLPMREFLRLKCKPSERKLRLFALACSARFRHLLPDERSRQAVELADAFVEGKATHRERVKVAAAAWEAVEAARTEGRSGAAIAAAVAAARIVDGDWPLFAERFGSSGELGQQYAWHADQDAVFLIDRQEQCAWLRDLFGNPFRPVTISSPRFPNTVAAIAKVIYESQAFQDLPVLADALEESGNADAELLAHCRREGQHIRGCWAIDLILGKEWRP